MAAPALAGDLWEITSTTYGPDGTPITTTDKKCLPKDGMDPSQIMGNMQGCTFDRKSGDATAMTFSMTCKMQGMPPELSAMQVTGDARLDGDIFTMHYTIMAVTAQNAPGSRFTMNGKAEAHKAGQCVEQQ